MASEFQEIAGAGQNTSYHALTAPVVPPVSDLVSLYRAVSEAELIGINDFGGFRAEPSGRSCERKLFATTAEDAVSWGRDMHQLYGGGPSPRLCLPVRATSPYPLKVADVGDVVVPGIRAR